ncbi:MAG: XRE family transcriptional regulator [Nitrospira sp.]|nr:MAG: XRE family transcriptional regulator [Nitrospira sp.]
MPSSMKKQFGYRCEYCEGTVRAKCVECEAFKHKSGFVILKQVTIGICDQCGNRYYTAAVLQRVHAIATGKIKPERTQRVPVAHAG